MFTYECVVGMFLHLDAKLDVHWLDSDVSMDFVLSKSYFGFRPLDGNQVNNFFRILFACFCIVTFNTETIS